MGQRGGHRGWSRAAEHGGLGYREVEREVSGGGLELRGAPKACWRVRIRCGAGFQRGAEGRAVTVLPRFSSQVRARAGKGREGKGKWGCCRVSRASWPAQGGLDQVVHLQTKIWLEIAHQVFVEMAARTQNVKF
jgi:hypothetical protein